MSEHSTPVTSPQQAHTLNDFMMQVSKDHDAATDGTHLEREENGERSEQQNSQVALPHGDYNNVRPLRSINPCTRVY